MNLIEMGQRMPQRYERSGTHLYLSNGYQKIFFIFKPIIPLPPNSLHLGLVKLGPTMTRSWEKGAQELHIFARNQEKVYKSQMGIQICFHICKWRIFLFKNHLHSGLTRINPKMIRIWSKWAQRMPQRYELSGTHLHLSNVYQKNILYF
jgi:hypothetical protein